MTVGRLSSEASMVLFVWDFTAAGDWKKQVAEFLNISVATPLFIHLFIHIYTYTWWLLGSSCIMLKKCIRGLLQQSNEQVRGILKNKQKKKVLTTEEAESNISGILESSLSRRHQNYGFCIMQLFFSRVSQPDNNTHIFQTSLQTPSLLQRLCVIFEFEGLIQNLRYTLMAPLPLEIMQLGSQASARNTIIKLSVRG